MLVSDFWESLQIAQGSATGFLDPCFVPSPTVTEFLKKPLVITPQACFSICIINHLHTDSSDDDDLVVSQGSRLAMYILRPAMYIVLTERLEVVNNCWSLSLELESKHYVRTCSVRWWDPRDQTAPSFYVLVLWTQWTSLRRLADRAQASL